MDYNLYIHSKNRNKGDTPYDMTLYLRNQIMARQDEYIKVSVMSFYMMNTMYNISSIIENNTFEVERIDINNVSTTSTYTIPDGNYSVLTFRDTLNTLLNGKISISYNYSNNTYTFLKVDTTNRYILKNIKCSKAIGISINTEITAPFGINSSFINMVEYQQIIIRSDLNYQDLCQDNISYQQDDLFNISKVLFWCSKQDVEPFKNISYNNCDAGDSFTYNIIEDNINSINFKVFNENNQLITDCPDWFLHLRFKVCKKETDTYINLMNKGLKLLADIKYVLINIFLFSINRKKR